MTSTLTDVWIVAMEITAKYSIDRLEPVNLRKDTELSGSNQLTDANVVNAGGSPEVSTRGCPAGVRPGSVIHSRHSAN
jgi:hypothetical protein